MLWISEHHRVITFASRHKHAGQLARHANEGDAPRDQCHIQERGRNDGEKAKASRPCEHKSCNGVPTKGEIFLQSDFRGSH